MDLGALRTCGRRVEDTQDLGDLVDVSADAFREAFGASVAMVVTWSDGSPPEASCSGRFPDPFLRGDGAAPYRLVDLEQLLVEEGVSRHRAMSLAANPSDRDGFVLVGWHEGVDVPVQSNEALELAADFVRQAIRRIALDDQLEASRQSIAELEEQLAGSGHLYMLGEMASGVAHDFNNTLTTILGTTEWLLQHATLEDEAREDLTHIRTAATDAAVYAHRLQLAARQVPTYSGRPNQVPSDRDKPRPTYRTEHVDLSAIATHMRALSRPRWSQLIERGVPIEFVVDAPPVHPIRGRASEIRELLLNLVFNAIDAMEETGGRLTLTVRENDGNVTLSVSDQGSGIADAVRPQIFEPFFTTKGKRGSGLGLSMCWRIAHQHGGTLDVETRVDQGTTFTLTLPAESGDIPVTSDTPEERRARRILLIDDQPDVRESVSDMLKALGHEVTLAADGQAGLRLIEDGAFDVILTDLRMPGMDGLDVAKRARTLQPEVPVVLLTGWGTLFEDTEPEAVAVVLPKPPTLHSLSEAIIRAATDVAA